MRKLLILVPIMTLLVAGMVVAQGKGKAPKAVPAAQTTAAPVAMAPKIGAKEVRDAIFKLQSPSPEEVLLSVQLLASSGSRDAAAPLTQLLLSGPRDDITDAIIMALGSIGQQSSLDTIISYLDHRRAGARLTAIMALETYRDARVRKTLEESLRDSDANVRMQAALALGKRGAKESVPLLFQAFDRGVADAAVSIGQLGSTADATRLADYLGKTDVRQLLPGFDEFLRRADIPQKAKIEILDRLLQLAGPEVRRFAVSYKATFPEGTDEDDNDLYKKVCQMVRQIPEN